MVGSEVAQEVVADSLHLCEAPEEEGREAVVDSEAEVVKDNLVKVMVALVGLKTQLLEERLQQTIEILMVPVCSSLIYSLIFLILFFDCKEQKSKMPLKK